MFWPCCVAGVGCASSLVQTLELQHEGKMWDSRMSAEQEQELTGTSGCLHFVFTGCAAFTGITLALTVPTELPAAVCLCVAAQVPSFRYSLDLGSLPASEQVWELCQK